jgi:hypothetical protein
LIATHLGTKLRTYWAVESVVSVRWKSSATLLEYPLIAVAVGRDEANNEIRGHARGIIAIGDLATGVLAIGGMARGVIALGGLAIGAFSFGGGGAGMFTLAGLAIGYFAIGGVAIGHTAIGGLAVGYYALGGAAFGKFVVSPLHWDSQAVEFFSKLVPGLPLPPRPPR